jgi:hypothetical protein
MAATVMAVAVLVVVCFDDVGILFSRSLGLL